MLLILLVLHSCHILFLNGDDVTCPFYISAWKGTFFFGAKFVSFACLFEQFRKCCHPELNMGDYAPGMKLQHSAHGFQVEGEKAQQ